MGGDAPGLRRGRAPCAPRIAPGPQETRPRLWIDEANERFADTAIRGRAEGEPSSVISVCGCANHTCIVARVAGPITAGKPESGTLNRCGVRILPLGAAVVVVIIPKDIAAAETVRGRPAYAVAGAQAAAVGREGRAAR